MKVAVTDLPEVILKKQLGLVPMHAPLHPINTESADGVAVSITAVQKLNVTEQTVPQLIE